MPVFIPRCNTVGVYTAGQVHGRCYRMRVLDTIRVLVAAANEEGSERDHARWRRK